MVGLPRPGTGESVTVLLELFGGFSARTSAGREIEIQTRKARALLALLALAGGKPESRAKLIGLLWSDRGENQARSSLRQALMELRRALPADREPLLIGEGDSLRLAATAVDVLLFERLAQSTAVEDLEQAAGLYRGPLLDGLEIQDPAFEAWHRAEAERLRARALEVLSRLADLQGGEAALETTRRFLALDPLSEPAHRRLMALYATQGDRAAAVRQFESCRTLLADELGLQPEAATLVLLDSIRCGQPAPEPAPVSSTGAAPARGSDKPICIVLPFDNLSGDAEQDYFADGITEDIIAALSRFRSLSVIGRSSSFRHRGREITVEDLRRDLDVAFIVEGSVRKAGTRVRITAQLIEAASGTQVWAERYDRDLVDIFAVQDEVTRAVVATAVGRIDSAARQKASRLSPDALKAYDLVLRGRHLIYAWKRESNVEARRLLERACQLDPTSGAAHSLICWSHVMDWASFWTDMRDEALEQAIDHGRRAVAIDESDGRAHAYLAEAYLFNDEDDRSRRHMERAAQLNPNDAEVRGKYGSFLTAVGEIDAALREFEEALELDPYDPAWLIWLYGFALYVARRYEAAVQTLVRIEEPHHEIFALLAACHAQLDRKAEARTALDRFRQQWQERQLLVPGAMAGDAEAYFKAMRVLHRENDMQHLLQGLRKAKG